MRPNARVSMQGRLQSPPRRQGALRTQTPPREKWVRAQQQQQHHENQLQAAFEITHVDPCGFF